MTISAIAVSIFSRVVLKDFAFLLVAHQNSNDVIIFKRDKTTGKLTPTGKKIELGRPVCLKFTK